MIRDADFRPAWWLPGPHLQTLWAALARRKPPVDFRRERLELPDGDFLDLDWAGAGRGPLIIVLHGLEGSSGSGYVRGLLARALHHGWRGVVMHFRNCSGESNRLTRSYNAGDTGDLDHLLTVLGEREPRTAIAAVGYSLGGNVLLKWLGERVGAAKLAAAVAVSVPFMLETAAIRMQRGVSRLYQRHLIAALRRSYARKFRAWPHTPPVDWRTLDRLQDFYSFDECITAPLHGYDSAKDYYARASCRSYLHAIRRPTLILHAVDDPFLLPSAIPEERELADQVVLELSRHGGHVGFVGGSAPWRAEYWLEQRIAAFLQAYL